jgi:hypothetical protein
MQQLGGLPALVPALHLVVPQEEQAARAERGETVDRRTDGARIGDSTAGLAYTSSLATAPSGRAAPPDPALPGAGTAWWRP